MRVRRGRGSTSSCKGWDPSPDPWRSNALDQYSASDGRDRDELGGCTGEPSIVGDQGVCLQPRQGDVFGVERVGPADLISDLPGDLLKDAVSEQPESQPADVRQGIVGSRSGQLTPARALVQQ